IQQYLQHENYALWDVIEFRDSYEVPASTASTTTTDTASDVTGKKKGMTITLTAKDMQKRKNDEKARTTLLLSLPDEHQLRFTEGSKTLEQKFNRLQVIVGQLQFMDVEIEHDDLNQKFLTSLAPEWLMHTIKKSEPNPQNMAFISLAKHSRGNEDVNTASVSTASTNVPTTSANIGIDEDDMEEMDIKWNMALLSMRADKFWNKAGKKISIQGTDVAGFDKSKVKCFNFHKMGHFTRECRATRSQDRGRRDNYRQGSKVEEQAPKALMAIDGEGLDGKLAGFQTASKDLDNLLESQRLDKNKEGLGYSVVPPPHAQIYSSPKKDMSWTGLLEFKDDTVTDYSRPVPTVESSPYDAQNRNPSITETEASISTISPKYFIKFVKANDSPTKSKIEKAEKAKKSPVKYAEQYKKPTQKPNVRGNKRNWNSLKSHQLGPNFKMKKNTCFNCGDFNHLAYDCRKRVKQGTSRSQNNTHKSFTPRPVVYKPYRPPGSSQNNFDDKGYWDSSCYRHLTGNISYLSDFEPFDGGYGSFGQGGCKITGKGTIKTGKLEFENVSFVKDL
nr:ribonuclease H-like domain-containing protein [Tanacetum cinerariifolium]